LTVWLVQTSVDWMHLIPGLTVIALGAAVALVARPRSGARALPSRARIAMIVAMAAIAVTGVITVAPRFLSAQAQTSADRALARDAPRAAIRDASTALEYDSSSVPAFTLRAAGFARLHDFAPALADLKRARDLEPRNWTTWALLGDLLTRRGDRSGARAAYRRAIALDPLEPDLKTALQSPPKSGR
jgi:Flp pilus assembly protein TadD